MTNRAHFLPAAAAAALLFVPTIAQASPADLIPATFHACAPAPQLVQVIDAVAPHSGGRELSSLRRLSGRSVSIAGSAGRYTVQSGSDVPMAVTAAVDKHACEAVDPAAVHLMGGGTVPGQNVAALAAVLAFRQSNTWPFGAAHIDDPRTMIDVQTRNGHVMVAIRDFKTLFTPNLDCRSEEWYRVDVQTFDVKPFDGCGADTPANHPLPKLKDLPD